MDCPRCGAKVPSADAFCGKCGYAMREQAPGRVDQSRIRVHEEPSPETETQPSHASSQQRLKTRTVLGVPQMKPPEGRPSPAPSAPGPLRPRLRRQVSQKTMLGIPRDDIPRPVPSTDESDAPDESAFDSRPPEEPAADGHRASAQVQHDSINEPVPVVRRRKNMLRGLTVLLLIAAAWLAYRYFTVHG